MDMTPPISHWIVQYFSGLASGITMVAAGTHHNCALTNIGAVLCWGDNPSGQLGDGTTVNRATPATVSGLNAGVAFITAGRAHTCALISSGAVQCWGSNDSGELGDGTSTPRTTLVDVPGLSSGVTAIAAGASSSYAIMTGAHSSVGAAAASETAPHPLVEPPQMSRG